MYALQIFGIHIPTLGTGVGVLALGTWTTSSKVCSLSL